MFIPSIVIAVSLIILAAILFTITRDTGVATTQPQKKDPPVRKTFTLVIDYGLSMRQMVRNGNYAFHSDFVAALERFTISGSGKQTVEVALFDLGSVKSDEAERLIQSEKGWMNASFEHLLAFGSQYPEEQRKHAIIALGTYDSNTMGLLRLLPTLTTNGSGGRELYADNWHGDAPWIGGRCQFLAVRIGQSSDSDEPVCVKQDTKKTAKMNPKLCKDLTDHSRQMAESSLKTAFSEIYSPIKIPSLDHFVASDKFRNGEIVDGMKMYLDDSFRTHLLGKQEPATKETTLRFHRPNVFLTPAIVFLGELGENAIITLGQLWQLCIELGGKDNINVSSVKDAPGVRTMISGSTSKDFNALVRGENSEDVFVVSVRNSGSGSSGVTLKFYCTQLESYTMESWPTFYPMVSK
jgi:hypothetical protein